MPILPMNLIWWEAWRFLLSDCHCALSLFLSLLWNIACVCSSVWKGMWAWGNPGTAIHTESLTDPVSMTQHISPPSPRTIIPHTPPGLVGQPHDVKVRSHKLMSLQIIQNCSIVQTVYIYLIKIKTTQVISSQIRGCSIYYTYSLRQTDGR